MRILYTTHQFLPDYSAGTEILTLKTSMEMLNRGHEVHIFTGYPVKYGSEKLGEFDRYEYDGIPVDRFYHSNRLTVSSTNVMEAEFNNTYFGDYFRKRIREIKPDIVHFYHLQRLSASAIDVCNELSVPTVFTATDFWLICPTNQLLLSDHSLCWGPDENAINCLKHMVSISQRHLVGSVFNHLPRWFLDLFVKCTRLKLMERTRYAAFVRSLLARPAHIRRRMNLLDMVLVATQFMADVLKRFGLNESRIRKVSFGIDEADVQRISEKGKQAGLRIGFVGTLYHHKGAHVLLEAVRLLPKHLPVKVKIFGSVEQFPVYSNHLKSMAGNDQRIKFCGTFPNSKIGEVFLDLDVLVVPSLWYENTPLVIHYAGAAKVPVVATNLGGVSEIITHGENGLLFDKGDVKGLSRILATLCNRRSLVQYLSQNSRSPKSIPSYVSDLETVYTEVLSGKASL